jgi:hypothetical protein
MNMARVAGSIPIDRLIGQVFDFVADERDEPRCSARMGRVAGW